MNLSKLLTAALAAGAIPLAAHAAAPPTAAQTKAMTFLDVEGRAVGLDAVVGDRPALLVFLRHFG